MRTRIDFLRFACLAAAALLSACAVAGNGEGEGAAVDGVNDMEDVESTSQALVLRSDPDLAAYLIAVNNGAIAQAELALTKAVDPDVSAFAQAMIADHTRANHQVAALLRQLGVVPTDNPLSASVAAQVAADFALLQSFTGPAFDWAYMDIQVRVHYQVLAQLQAQLVALAPGYDLDVQWLIPEFRSAMARSVAAALSIRRFLSSRPGRPVYRR